jgi:hypothetical protein
MAGALVMGALGEEEEVDTAADECPARSFPLKLRMRRSPCLSSTLPEGQECTCQREHKRELLKSKRDLQNRENRATKECRCQRELGHTDDSSWTRNPHTHTHTHTHTHICIYIHTYIHICKVT